VSNYQFLSEYPDDESSLIVKAELEEMGVNVQNPNSSISSIKKAILPNSFALHQNYPNPFNPETVISYQLAVGSHIELKVYSITGQLIRTLVHYKQDAGYYNIKWDGKDDNDRTVPSGIYLYTLQAGSNMATRKMVLLK
jgi:hypothetical protein